MGWINLGDDIWVLYPQIGPSVPNYYRIIIKMVSIHSQVLPSGRRKVTTMKNMVLILIIAI
jgi:hypothetical protein